MTGKQEQILEDATPNPEFLIKSISEQGYSLATALADLLDNSISADAKQVEILLDTENEPFTLYLADNGNGMDEKTLRESMQFPSASPEENRGTVDLGRFGLGMKTASFSQARRFTVLSRKKGEKDFIARTWDVELLKRGKWQLLVNSREDITELVANYKKLSSDYLSGFTGFEPNTIIVWHGLYKFQNYLEQDNRRKAVNSEINEVTTEHLALVFHRFMEDKNNPLQIRVNNQSLRPFNPFPINEPDFRPLEYRQRSFGADDIKLEGFILPARSMDEVKQSQTFWTTKQRGLMDMEGIYIYRAKRLILFGGWNGLIKKVPRLQLARLRVEIGNSADHLLHLNVAKSQVIIPHDLISAFEHYIAELKIEAEREFYNRGIKRFSNSKKENKAQLFTKVSSNKGAVLELNSAFPLLSEFKDELTTAQTKRFNSIIRMVNTAVNKMRSAHQDRDFTGVVEKDGMDIDELIDCITTLKAGGISVATIKQMVLPDFAFNFDSLPDEVLKLLK